LEWGLDGAIVALLLGLAARILHTRDLFEATVLFIAFGLTLSLAWARLGAPDLALAEAALGAGVTGALLLNAYRRFADREEKAAPAVDIGSGEAACGAFPDASLRAPCDRVLRLRPILGAVLGILAAGFVVFLVTLPVRLPILPSMVADRLAETAVSNPVTAVLLDFRAYDTLLEMTILVVAMVAVWSMDREAPGLVRLAEEGPGEDAVLEALINLVVPVAGLTALYLVWAGASASGGAFQGGALLAGVGVLLLAAGIVHPVTAQTALVRGLGVMGLGVLVLVGLVVMVWTGSFLAYPEGTAYVLVLLAEGALVVSIATILLELFVDVPAVPEKDPTLEWVDPTGDPLGRSSDADGIPTSDSEEDG